MSRARSYCFADISDESWQDWRWQLSHRITALEELSRFFPLGAEELIARQEVVRRFPMGITPYYLSLMRPGDPGDPLARQSVPLAEELLDDGVAEDDPLAEERSSPVPGLTHRYPDRVLMVVTNACAVYCRHCLRKRIMGTTHHWDIDRMVGYLAENPSIREVLISGGDPLLLESPVLEKILAKVRAIPHVEILRIGSRTPATLPQRIDDELCTMLQAFHPLWINVHFNHPAECTEEAALACDRLLRAGIPLNNQTVLLRGVNDDLATMKALVHALMRMRVRPYYLFQCDPVSGTTHLRTTVAKGMEIMEGLRGHTSGLAVPTYAIDAPGGGGKIPAGPQYILSYEEGRLVFRNYQGKIYEYRDPTLRKGPATGGD